MKNTIKTVGMLAVMAGAVTQVNAATLVSDDFTSGTITETNRLRQSNIGNDWTATNGTLWATGSGTLTNAGSATDATAEGGIFNVLDVAAGSFDDHTEITISFDYALGSGVTLYFHSIGLSGGTTGGLNGTGTQLHNTGSANGSIQSQYDGGGTAQGDYVGIHLLTGAASPSGAPTAGGTLTGSGTFTQIIQLGTGAYLANGISDVNDLRYITSAFSSNITDTANGSIAINDFSVTAAAVPEPSSTALLGLSGLALILRRRK